MCKTTSRAETHFQFHRVYRELCVQKRRLASAGLWEILCVWTGRLVLCVERRLDFSQSPGNSVCARVSAYVRACVCACVCVDL